MANLKNPNIYWYSQVVEHKFLHNIILLEHDMEKLDNWTNIIFTTPSAMSTLIFGSKLFMGQK